MRDDRETESVTEQEREGVLQVQRMQLANQINTSPEEDGTEKL